MVRDRDKKTNKLTGEKIIMPFIDLSLFKKSRSILINVRSLDFFPLKTLLVDMVRNKLFSSPFHMLYFAVTLYKLENRQSFETLQEAFSIRWTSYRGCVKNKTAMLDLNLSLY